jgi:hypothetical protein
MSEHVLLAKKILKDGEEPFTVDAYDSEIVSELWFKTSPLETEFIHRAIRLQLVTDSHDQGAVSDEDAGAWTWFELCILEDENATQPLVRDGKALSWSSHVNRLNKDGDTTRHFGTMFDRRHDLLDLLEVSHAPILLRPWSLTSWS